MGGVAQSKELCSKATFPEEVFIHTNAAELVALLNAINDAYTLSMRGRLPPADSEEGQRRREESKEEIKRHRMDSRGRSTESPSNRSPDDRDLSEREKTLSPPSKESSELWSSHRGRTPSAESLDETTSDGRADSKKGWRRGSRRTGSPGMKDGVDDRKRSDEEDEDGPGKFTEEEIEQLFESFKHIYLANHYLGDVGILPGILSHDALRVMAKNKYLHTLDLSFNYLSEKAVLPLMNLLREMPRFRHLSLGGNPVGHEGCIHVADFLAEDPPLEVLSLFHCYLTDEDCLTLLNGLRFNTHLKLLNLDFNFCTWKFVHSLIELVRDQNETLAVVLFESVPHDPLTLKVLPQDTVTKIEYPCTPAGFFRSFQTYYNPDGMNEVEQKAAAERFLLRRLVCRMDFTGLKPFPPSLLLELEQYLGPRRDAYVAELEDEREMKLEEDMQNVIGSRKVDGDQLLLEKLGHDVWAPASQRDGGEREREVEQWRRSSAILGWTADNQIEDGIAAGRLQKPAGSLANHGGGRGGRGRSSSRYRQTNGFSGCLRRVLPPLNSPERLQMVMMEAYQFRQKLARGSVRPIGEKILPNGFDRVWLPPLTQGGAQALNYIVNDKPSYLKACWCDPHDAASPYAGRLHYHCKLEEYIDYSQSATAKKKTEKMGEEGSRTTGRGGSVGRHGPRHRRHFSRERDPSRSSLQRPGTLLPQAPSGGRPSMSKRRTSFGENPLTIPPEHRPPRHDTRRDSSGMNDSSDSLDSTDVVEAGNSGPNRQPYHGCQGTGHRCVSMKVTPGALGAGAHKMAQTGGPPREKVIHTNKEGLTMALHYNPVIYFTSPYKPAAAIIENQ